MKITIVCQYFYPEEFKVNDLAEEWVKRGAQCNGPDWETKLSERKNS